MNMYKKGGVDMESLNYVWEVIIALGGAIFTCYGLILRKASKKDLETLRRDVDGKISNYATKDDLKSLKEDILRAITHHENEVSLRLEDKFDTILQILNAKGRIRRK